MANLVSLKQVTNHSLNRNVADSFLEEKRLDISGRDQIDARKH